MWHRVFVSGGRQEGRCETQRSCTQAVVHSSIFRISILGKQLDTLARTILAVFSSEYDEIAIYRGLDISDDIVGCDDKDSRRRKKRGRIENFWGSAERIDCDREWYRPFAPTIVEPDKECAYDSTVCGLLSRFMSLDASLWQ